MLSVRQVTNLLQQFNAETPAQDGVLQYPHLLDMLCRCAVLLRQQVHRKLTGPWVNITEVTHHLFADLLKKRSPAACCKAASLCPRLLRS